MNVGELIEILKGYDAAAEVELAVVASVGDADEEIAVDRYVVDGVWLWPGDEDDDDDNGPALWLIGGEEEDVEAFMDAIENDEDAG